MGNLFRTFYAQNLEKLIICFVLFLVFYTLLSYLFTIFKKEKIFRIISIVLATLSFFAILNYGIIGRNVGNRVLNLNPLYLFYEAKVQPEMYRSMLMNVFLFVPFGVTLPFAIETKSIGKTFLITIIIGLVLTLGLETAQYIFKMGNAETIDVICNFLGMLIGTLPFVISRNITKYKMI